jgi:pimeloyl-ACP methyl ester carboxylesterase
VRGTLVAAVALLAVPTGCALKFQSTTLDYAGEPHPVVRVGEADIRYSVSGPEDGEAVVLIHGFGSSLAAWDALVPALEDRYRVLRLDLKGFGRSSKYAADYGLDEHVAVILALMDHEGLGRAHLVAHSWGTAVALALAEAAQDRVGRLVLTSAWVYEGQLPWALRSARTAGMGELIFGLWYAENLDWRFGLSFHAPERWVTEDVMERSRAMLLLPGAKAAALATVRDLDLADRQQRYGQIDVPALLVFGQQDQVARPAFGERLQAHLPTARLEILPRCGHFPMIEHAALYNDLVRNWLDGDPGVAE